MWSPAVRVVGGCGSAFEVPVVAVLKVEAALGEDGEGMLRILAVPGVSLGVDVGLRMGRGSGNQIGRAHV